MATDQVPQRENRLEELFAKLDEAEDSEDAFLGLIFEGAAQRDPQLPDLLRAAAIPRALNVAIVGALRDTPDDAEGNRRLLELISEYRFVLPRPDGGVVYHDNTRDALLSDWQSTDEKRARFTELNETLAAFHEKRYAESREADRSLSEVSALMARANPGRLRRVSAAVEAGMAANLLDALYHHLLADPRGGFDFFQSSFFELETAERAVICRSLISFTRDFLQRLPESESEPALLAWLDYFEARVQRTSPGYDAAHVEELIRRLLDREDLPPDLRTWALEDLALFYEAQLKMDRALATRRELLELAEQQPEVDIYNRPLRHSNLASLYSWLDDNTEAVAQFQLAIKEVDELPDARPDIGVLARLDLSGVYAQLGDWAAAFEAAIEAFYRARTFFAGDRIMQRSVATRMADLLSTFDLAASDCAFAESLALAEARSDDWQGAFLGHIDRLIEAHRLRHAGARIDELDAELDEGEGEGEGESALRLNVAYRQGRLAELEDRPADADSVYSTLLEQAADRREVAALRISTLMRRGSLRATLGNTKRAIEDLGAAREEWVRCGCPIDAARTDILLAEAHLKAGDTAAARELLNVADATVPLGISENRVMLLTVRGDLCAQEGARLDAAAEYERAVDAAVASRDLKREASLLRRLAGLHHPEAQPPSAADWERRARLAGERLGEVDGYDATDERREADGENGKGVRSLTDVEDRTTALYRAREFFAAAERLDPANFWPLLNVSFAYGEQGDWQGATEAMGRVLDLCPAPMRTARLHGCLRDHVLEYAKGLVRRDDPDQAAEVLAAALGRLSDELPAAELTSLRAVHAVALAVTGQRDAAQDAYREALGAAEGEGSRVLTIAELIHTVEGYWTLDALLQDVADDPGAPPAWRERAAADQAALAPRLDELLGLTPDPSALDIPVVTPIVVEVGDELVPIVDSRQDGGMFLYQLIPAMRDRILAGTGVTVPGVRMRGNPALPPDGFSAQIDEVPTESGSVPLGASFSVRRAHEERPSPPGELTDFHPLTGQPGLWILVQAAEGHPTAPDFLSSAQYLVHRIERVVRDNIPRFLGPDEVATLVEVWSGQDDGDLVASVVPDTDARIRLTWVLQRLLSGGVPITDWQSVLTAVRNAGGIQAPSRILAQAVRARLRDRLPGPQTGRRPVRVPAEHEDALLDRLPSPPTGATRSAPRHEFLCWLRQAVAESGPGLTLVTATQEGRELVSTLARSENRLITVLSADEVPPA